MPPTTPIARIYPTALDPQTGLKEQFKSRYPHQPLPSILLPWDQEGLDTTNTRHAPYLPPSLRVTQGPRPQRITGLSHHTTQTRTPTTAIFLSLMFLVLLCGFVLVVSTRSKLKTTSGIRGFSGERFWTFPYRNSKTKIGPIQERSPRASHVNNKEHVRNTWKPQPRAAENQDVGSSGRQMNDSPGLSTWGLPSFRPEDSLTLWADCGAPSVAGFQQYVREEEVDITLANAMPLSCYNSTRPGLGSAKRISRGLIEGEDRGVTGIMYGTAQDSDTSRSTHPTSELDVFSISSISPSSLTSVTDASHNIELGGSDIGEDTGEDEDVTFEVAQAQNQSVKIKRGILVDGSVQRAPLSHIPGADALLFGPPSSPLADAIPSVVVTSPTLAITGPSLSSISVDLSDFPLPPLILNCETFGSLLQGMSEFSCHANMQL